MKSISKAADIGYLFSFEEGIFMKERPFDFRVVKCRTIAQKVAAAEDELERLREELKLATAEMAKRMGVKA